MHKFHHGRVPKLKDIAKDGIAKAIERRAKKEGPSGVQHLLGLLGETTVPALAACPLQQAATARALDNKLPPFVGAALNGGWSGDAVTALPLGWEGKDENLIEDTNWGS